MQRLLFKVVHMPTCENPIRIVVTLACAKKSPLKVVLQMSHVELCIAIPAFNESKIIAGTVRETMLELNHKSYFQSNGD